VQANGAGEIAVICRQAEWPPDTTFSGEITACGTMDGKPLANHWQTMLR